MPSATQTTSSVPAEGFQLVDGVTPAFGVRQGDRVLLYAQPRLELAAPDEVGTIKAWVAEYKAQKAVSTQKKCDAMLARLNDPANRWGFVHGHAGDDDSERCSVCEGLDNNPKGLGGNNCFPCVVPVSEVTKVSAESILATFYEFDQKPTSEVKSTFIGLVSGQCVACSVKGVHCSLCMNSQLGPLPDITLRRRYQKQMLERLVEVKEALTALRTEMKSHAASFTVEKISDFVLKIDDDFANAKVLGRGE